VLPQHRLGILPENPAERLEMMDTTVLDYGHYTDEAIVAFLDDGRLARLVTHFGYFDRHGLRWDVPAGAIVDGASIPRPLWTIIGGPFEGKYRAASIVHDWFCDLRSRPWRSVHRMFFEAMLASGVSGTQAKMMYSGVYWGGPRWSQTVVDNTQLVLNQYLHSGAQAEKRAFHARGYGVSTNSASGERSERGRSYCYALEDKDVDELAKLTGIRNLTLEEIERVVDERLTSTKYIEL
jgi:hypothetical protein